MFKTGRIEQDIFFLFFSYREHPWNDGASADRLSTTSGDFDDDS